MLFSWNTFSGSWTTTIPLCANSISMSFSTSTSSSVLVHQCNKMPQLLLLLLLLHLDWCHIARWKSLWDFQTSPNFSSDLQIQREKQASKQVIEQQGWSHCFLKFCSKPECSNILIVSSSSSSSCPLSKAPSLNFFFSGCKATEISLKIQRIFLSSLYSSSLSSFPSLATSEFKSLSKYAAPPHHALSKLLLLL